MQSLFVYLLLNLSLVASPFVRLILFDLRGGAKFKTCIKIRFFLDRHTIFEKTLTSLIGICRISNAILVINWIRSTADAPAFQF